MKIDELVPPLELCKKIPAGEFEDSAFVFVPLSNGKEWQIKKRMMHMEAYHSKIYPAPTLQEILEELHKHQEDVFLKWSETAYHEWLVNAYTHNKEDYQSHHKNIVVAAIKTWLEMKGIEA